jgi:hypothetical protein
MSILQEKQSDEKENELNLNFINSVNSDVTKEI